MWAKEKWEEWIDCYMWVQQTHDKAQDPQTEDRHNIKGENDRNHKKTDIKLLEGNDLDDFYTVKNIQRNPYPKWTRILYHMRSVWQRHWWSWYLFNKIDSSRRRSDWDLIQKPASNFNQDVASKILRRHFE